MPQAPVLALDVGGTKLAAGVVSAEGTLLSSFHRVDTVVTDGPDAVVERLLGLGEKALAEIGDPDVSAVGIGCGGPLDPRTGVILGPPGLPGWDEVPLGSTVTLVVARAPRWEALTRVEGTEDADPEPFVVPAGALLRRFRLRNVTHG